mmetsp:Transcript_25344/g.56129  ORF Transcript_25344/g.56129 Transcript_25344/m.56129 type:complete len:82 (-) Transcript_25344:1109-1354(-)
MGGTLDRSPLVSGLLGTLATVVATLLTYPLMTTRTRRQTSVEPSSSPSALFSGVCAKLLSSAVNSFCFFAIRQGLELLLLS